MIVQIIFTTKFVGWSRITNNYECCGRMETFAFACCLSPKLPVPIIFHDLFIDIGKKWCSIDKYPDDGWLYCHQSEDSILLRTNPLHEARNIARKHCYQRGSAPFKSDIFDEFAFYINEILSCVHSGQKIIETVTLEPGYDRKFVKSNESCDFLLQRDSIPYYQCFNDPAISDGSVKTCYSNQGNLIHCFENTTRSYE